MWAALCFTILPLVCLIEWSNVVGGIKDIFIDNINHGSVFYIIAASLLSLNSIFSYPIIAYPPVLCIENAIHDGGTFVIQSLLETNEDKTFVKSPKKWVVRLSVLVFVVLVGTFYPKFKDIISFDILFSTTLEP